MKLQVNNSGAWKTVVDFPAVHLAWVKDAAAGLKDVSPRPISFRVLDDRDEEVAHLPRTSTTWQETRRRAATC